MVTRNELLRELNFGSVDSESEENLDKIFIQTDNFEDFLNDNIALMLGSKGAGKSAIFRLFSQFEDSARKMSGHRLDNIYLVAGTGFKDTAEMDDMQILNLIEEGKVTAEASWKIYITFKIIHELYRKYKIICGNKSKRVLQKVGDIKDCRLLGVISFLFRKFIGELPKVNQIDFGNISISVSSHNSISIYDLLNEINSYLDGEKKTVWILLDKIDELFANNIEGRKKCIEGLFMTYIDFVARYSNIKLKIFLRTDIWSTLSFVNKSHITDKTTTIKWMEQSLRELLLKRACQSQIISQYVYSKANISDWSDSPERSFDVIFPAQVYSGPREAKTLSWMIERATDGLSGVYPREIINFSNYAVKEDLKSPDEAITSIISGNAIKHSFAEVSKVKVESYLSEFSHLQKHFERFNGKQTATFTQSELIDIMAGLEPSGEEMIKQLHETGVISYSTQNALTSQTTLTIPRLFRIGLGIVMPGRP